MAFALVKVQWAKMDAVKLTTEGPPTGKEHCTPERWIRHAAEVTLARSGRRRRQEGVVLPTGAPSWRPCPARGGRLSSSSTATTTHLGRCPWRRWPLECRGGTTLSCSRRRTTRSRRWHGNRSGLHRIGTSDVTSEAAETNSSPATEDDEKEEESNCPPEGGRKKRAASTDLEAEASKKGRVFLADNNALDADSSFEWRPREKSLAESPAHARPQRSLSSGNSLDPNVMDSGSLPAASSPKAADDAEVLSRRTFPGQGEV
nr:uncharacterized protein LOC109771429 [Aegilops tauschii subsp. strangulata]